MEASRCIIGRVQEAALRAITTNLLMMYSSGTMYRFGSSLSKIKVITKLRMPLSDCQVLYFYAYIIDENTPLLLRLYVMQENGLVLKFPESTMQMAQYSGTLPVTFFHGHSFVILPALSIFFTITEPTRLHFPIFHPSADKLFRLVQRADPIKLPKK